MLNAFFYKFFLSHYNFFFSIITLCTHIQLCIMLNEVHKHPFFSIKHQFVQKITSIISIVLNNKFKEKQFLLRLNNFFFLIPRIQKKIYNYFKKY